MGTTNRHSNVEKRSPTKQLNKLILNPLARQHTRQHSISAVYETSLGSQEQIVEKAKQVCDGFSFLGVHCWCIWIQRSVLENF